MIQFSRIARDPLTPDRGLFGECLRECRWGLELSQADVCSRLKVARHETWLSRFECGQFYRLPPVEEFRDLCSVLKLNPVTLLVECGFLKEREVAAYLQALPKYARA